MVFQKFVGLTRHSQQVTVLSNRGKHYTASLGDGVEIPEPIRTGNANYIRCNVEFADGNPFVTGFDWEGKPTQEELEDLDSMMGDY